MLRIILSIILGVLIPISYVFILSFGEGYISDDWIATRIYNQPAPGILLAPVTLPIYFNIFVKEKRILLFFFDTFWFRASSSIIFTWALYAVISYFILGRFERFKKRAVVVSSEPPPPPVFEK